MTLSVPHRIECKPCRHNQGVGIIGELTKEFSEQNAGFEPEDVELMLCCLTGRLPLSEDTTVNISCTTNVDGSVITDWNMDAIKVSTVH